MISIVAKATTNLPSGSLLCELPVKGRMLTVGSLFSGIEGFGLGFERAGARVVWHVEKDEACQRVISARFQREPAGRGTADGHLAAADERRGEAGSGIPGGPALFGDVRTVGASNLSAVDLVCGGFPCQDLSVAGRRAGLAGERSGLWHEFHRILSELRPRWVVIENVPGLLSSNNGRDMAVVLGGLAELGYGWAYRVLDAQFFGVAQRRRRVFIVGCLGDTARAVQVLFEPESCDGDTAPSRQAREDIAAGLTAGAGTNSCSPGHNRDALMVADTVRSHPRPGSNTVGALTASQDNGSTGNSQVESGQIIVAKTLTSGGHPNSNAPGSRHEDDVNLVAHTLSSEGSDASEDGTGRGTPLVAYPIAMRGRDDGAEFEMGAEGVYNALRAGDGGSSRANHLLAGAAVRRLTPVECERLQGFPDGWTAGHADSTRYRMLGNAVCVPVAHWIGVRITNAEAMAQS